MPGWLGSILAEVASLSEGSGPEHVKNSPGFGHHLTLTTQFVGLTLGSPGQRKRQEAAGVRSPWLWVLCPGFCSLSALLVCLFDAVTCIRYFIWSTQSWQECSLFHFTEGHREARPVPQVYPASEWPPVLTCIAPARPTIWWGHKALVQMAWCLPRSLKF